MRLKDKVAIVTGGGKGLGKVYAKRFSAEGAKVAVVDVDLDAAKAVTEGILAAGHEALALEVNVSDEKSVNEMSEKTVAKLERIDILVNNAAIMFRFLDKAMKPCDEYTVEEWDKIMAVNVRGVWLCSKAVLPHMKKQGKGKIINASSDVVFSGTPTCWLPYITSKSAVIGLTRALAREVGQFGIRVNAIAPGMTLTETMMERVSPEGLERAIASRAIKQKAHPEDIVGTVVFLASDESDFITGQTIVVNGGNVLH